MFSAGTSIYNQVAADTIECEEKMCKGTDNADVLIGNKLSNKINGMGGSDYILGLFGNDYLIGQNGTDYIFGGHGNDIIHGGGNNDDSIQWFEPMGCYSDNDLSASDFEGPYEEGWE